MKALRIVFLGSSKAEEALLNGHRTREWKDRHLSGMSLHRGTLSNAGSRVCCEAAQPILKAVRHLPHSFLAVTRPARGDLGGALCIDRLHLPR